MLDAEVFILGAGPTGACAAINLAALHTTVVADRHALPRGRLVESLPPAASRLLADMGLLQPFLAEGHGRWQVRRSIWERPHIVEDDLLRDPDGLGWHLDRPRFTAWLRSMAVARGASVFAPAEVESVEGGPDTGWRVGMSSPAGPIEVAARFVVDAGGRNAPLAARLGARRRRLDRLACGWVEGIDRREAPSAVRRSETYLEAAPDGWWYTAAVRRGRLLAFYTDADLPAVQWAGDPGRLVDAATTTRWGWTPCSPRRDSSRVRRTGSAPPTRPSSGHAWDRGGWRPGTLPSASTRLVARPAHRPGHRVGGRRGRPQPPRRPPRPGRWPCPDGGDPGRPLPLQPGTATRR